MIRIGLIRNNSKGMDRELSTCWRKKGSCNPILQVIGSVMQDKIIECASKPFTPDSFTSSSWVELKSINKESKVPTSVIIRMKRGLVGLVRSGAPS